MVVECDIVPFIGAVKSVASHTITGFGVWDNRTGITMAAGTADRFWSVVKEGDIFPLGGTVKGGVAADTITIQWVGCPWPQLFMTGVAGYREGSVVKGGDIVPLIDLVIGLVALVTVAGIRVG